MKGRLVRKYLPDYGTKKESIEALFSGSDALLHIFGQVMTGSSIIYFHRKDNHEFPKTLYKKAIFDGSQRIITSGH